MRLLVSAMLVTQAGGFRKAGVGRHMLSILDRLAMVDLGHEIHAYLPNDVTLPEAWAASPWMRWHQVPSGSARERVSWEHWKLGFESKRIKADAYFSLFPAVPIGPSAPVVSFMFDAFPKTHPEGYTPRKRLISNGLHVHTARKARRIITISESAKQEIAKAYRYPLDRLDIAYCGPGNELAMLSPEAMAAVDLSAHGVTFGRYVLTVSTLEPRKNLSRLIQAMHRLKEDPAVADLGLVVAGARGWMENEIFKTVSELGMESRVNFLGYVPDEVLPALYQKAHVFALPSIVEGFGIPVLEAMIMGVPVVTSNTSSLPEVAGEAGFYCDPMSPESIASAIRQAATDEAERARRVWLGHEQQERFTWDAAIRAVDASLRKVVR